MISGWVLCNKRSAQRVSTLCLSIFLQKIFYAANSTFIDAFVSLKIWRRGHVLKIPFSVKCFELLQQVVSCIVTVWDWIPWLKNWRLRKIMMFFEFEALSSWKSKYPLYLLTITMIFPLKSNTSVPTNSKGWSGTWWGWIGSFYWWGFRWFTLSLWRRRRN